MDYYVKVLILAVIQGAAELLPVSSSAHVIVAEKLMGLDPSQPRETFLLIMLHTGTMFAVLVYFWPRWKPLLLPSRTGAISGSVVEQDSAYPQHSLPQRDAAATVWQRYRFLWLTLLATAVTGALGYGLIRLIEMATHEEVEQLFKRLDLIGAALACAGLLILASGFLEGRAKQVNGLPLWTALLIGVVQALTLPFRGFSRSGATISTSLLCGVSRRLSEDFSFALAVLLTPPAVGRMVLRLVKAKALLTWDDVLPGLVGMVFSFAAGYIALQLLSAALERGRWKYFGFYCLAAAAVLVGLAAYGW